MTPVSSSAAAVPRVSSTECASPRLILTPVTVVAVVVPATVKRAASGTRVVSSHSLNVTVRVVRSTVAPVTVGAVVSPAIFTGSTVEKSAASLPARSSSGFGSVPFA